MDKRGFRVIRDGETIPNRDYLRETKEKSIDYALIGARNLLRTTVGMEIPMTDERKKIVDELTRRVGKLASEANLQLIDGEVINPIEDIEHEPTPTGEAA